MNELIDQCDNKKIFNMKRKNSYRFNNNVFDIQSLNRRHESEYIKHFDEITKIMNAMIFVIRRFVSLNAQFHDMIFQIERRISFFDEQSFYRKIQNERFFSNHCLYCEFEKHNKKKLFEFQ